MHQWPGQRSRWAFLKRAMVFEHAVGTRCRTAVPVIP
jgi:hypothetical protein